MACSTHEKSRHWQDGDIVQTRVFGTDGQPATMYKTQVYQKAPFTKLILAAAYSSTTVFVNGFAIIALFCLKAPRWLSVPSVLAYFAHVFFGNAHHTGSLEWPWYRARQIGLAVAEYFDMQTLLEDGVDFKPDRAYLFGQHPHGVFFFGAIPWMMTNARNPIYKLFPHLVGKVHGTGASVVYFFPWIRECLLFVGNIVVSRKTLERFLKKRHSVGIIVGGEAECLVQENGKDIVVLAGRKGFVRLALQYGADLVPTYTFNNVDAFNINKTLFKGTRDWLQRNYKLSIPVTWGLYGTPLARPVPLLLAVGTPIQVPQPITLGAPVDEKLVDEYHERYTKDLCALFERYKHLAGYPKDRILTVLEAPEALKNRSSQS